MVKRTKSRPKPIQWRVEALVYWLVEVLTRWLPGPLVFHLGEVLGSIVWHLLPERRRAVERNLRIAYAGEKDLPEIRKLAKASMRRAAANMISAAHAASLKPEQLSNIVTVEGSALLEEASGKGKGVVLLLAHMGNWELLSRLIHFLPRGTKTGAFYRPLNNPLLDAKVLARRQADGTRMFSKRDPFHQVTGYLREGAVVGVLVDQRVGRKGDPVDFFGRRTGSSPLPALLARRTKCEVLALSLFAYEPGKWKVVFLPVEDPPTTQNCMSALEAAMKPHPEDVFWLQNRWKVMVRRGRWHHEVPSNDKTTAKPSRVLVWCGSAEEVECPTGSWSDPCTRYEFAIPKGNVRPMWLPDGARCHEIASMGVSSLKQGIVAIDRAEVLPLDVILIYGEDGEVQEAARKAGITAIPVPPR